MTYAQSATADWIRQATRDQLMDRLAALDPSANQHLSPRDTELRAELVAQIRKEVQRRDAS